MIDPVLLEILRCPFHPDSSELILKDSLLICPVDGQGFRIIDGIPDLLPEDVISAEKVQEILSKT